jgi:hypothetical protein
MVNKDDRFDHSLRAVDLRIAIGRHYGFDFEQRVRESNSNSLAAICLLRHQLDHLAKDLGIDPDAYTKPELQDSIREACALEPRGTELDWRELQQIIVELDIPIPEDVRYEPTSRSVEQSNESSDDVAGGPWADWTGGESEI